MPLRGSGCRNLALPGVYEQALPFAQLLSDLLIAELDAHNFQTVHDARLQFGVGCSMVFHISRGPHAWKILYTPTQIG